MKATFKIEADLMAKAKKPIGIMEKTFLLNMKPEALIKQRAGHVLTAMGGSDPTAQAGQRRCGR